MADAVGANVRSADPREPGELARMRREDGVRAVMGELRGLVGEGVQPVGVDDDRHRT
jgi:hypothetical protein